MNRPIRKVAVALMVLFAALLVNANWVQVGQADRLAASPSGADRRIDEQLERQRGEILAADGTKIATSVKPEGSDEYLRQYPSGMLYADVTGYWGGTSVSPVGLELAEDKFLSGEDDRLLASRVTGLFSGDEVRGGSITTTIVPQIQQAAANALAGRRGAVVALDPQTGAVLAMVTSPTYDPNPLASRSGNVALDAFTTLKNDSAQPLLVRPTQETYPPGSTFKVVTAAAALRNLLGGDIEAEVFAPRVLDLPLTNTNLPNFGGESCGSNDRSTLIQALTISCNTAFGSLGIDLHDQDPDLLREQAEGFGLNSTLDDFPLPQVLSVFPAGLDEPQSAQAAIGQNDVRVTPLQMAEIAATIGNGGTRMKPYLVESYLGPDGDQISRTRPDELDQAIDSATAGGLTTMMENVVNDGTGHNAQIDSVRVAGKTGTAEFGTQGQAHAWFIGFAPAVNPKIAVAVIVENGGFETGTGGAVAAPVAKQVLQTGLDILQ